MRSRCLLEAAEQATARAPAVAIRWLDASLRLLPDDDRDSQIEVRVSLASALRSVGELERCRAVLLETIELLPPESVVRRVELTTWCAAVEHWLGKHEAARTRLLSAWDDLDDPAGPEGVGLQIELAVDGLYTMDIDQTIEMGRGALERARKLGHPPLVAAAASALALGEASQGLTEPAREHRAEAIEVLDRLPDEELTSSLEAFYYIAWVENYLELYDEALAHIDRAIAISRSTGQGRLVIPLMLTKGYPLELQGRLAEAAEMCDAAVEAARLSANTHFLYWALFELGFACYFAGDLEGAIAACEESLQFGDRLTGATIPSAGGGPGWALAITLVTAGETERGLAAMHALGGDEIEFAVPVERCFDWEGFALGELAAGNIEAAEGYAAAPRSLRESLTSTCRPDSLREPGQRSCSSRTRRPRPSPSPGWRWTSALPQARICRPPSREAFSETRSAEAGERTEAIEEIREAERVLDACGSVRERDCGSARAAKAWSSPRGEGPGCGRVGHRLTDQARARDRQPRHRSEDEQGGGRRPLPQREDDRVAPAEHLLQAWSLLARRGGSRARARASRASRQPDVSSESAAQSADELRLAELGYRQELKRGLRLGDTAALGFAGISPVVGLYAVVLVGTAVAGPAWLWVLPIALAGQCLLLGVYSELASQFPIAGGAYQWSRRLIGGSYGWFNGWVAVCAYAAANTTIAYLGRHGFSPCSGSRPRLTRSSSPASS